MGQEYNTSGTLSASQLLFNGSYIVGLQAAKHVRQLQESSLMVTKEDVVFNVIQAYQLATIAKGNLGFADSMVLLTEELVNMQEQYFELDLILQEDVDQLSYSLLVAKNAQLAAEVQYNSALNLLKFSMGYDMELEIGLSESVESLLNQKVLSRGDLHNNLHYTVLQQNVTLSELNVRNNRFANLPTLSAFFSHTYNAYRNEFNFFANEKWYPQTVWGLQLNIPVFSGLQRHARTKQAKIKVLQGTDQLKQLERTLQFQEIQLRNDLKGARDRYELQKKNMELARSIYENAQKVRQIGKTNSMEVTQKHNQLMQTQAMCLASLVELFQAQLNLDKLYNKLVSQNQ